MLSSAFVWVAKFSISSRCIRIVECDILFISAIPSLGYVHATFALAKKLVTKPSGCFALYVKFYHSLLVNELLLHVYVLVRERAKFISKYDLCSRYPLCLVRSCEEYLGFMQWILFSTRCERGE